MSGFNTEEIIRMAEQAGMERCKCEPRCHLHTGGMGSLTYFAKLVAAAEREACAKLCERGNPLVKPAMTQHQCAAAIRARGNNAA
jgi:hypothetical protein